MAVLRVAAAAAQAETFAAAASLLGGSLVMIAGAAAQQQQHEWHAQRRWRGGQCLDLVGPRLWQQVKNQMLHGL
jgi:hypothetical protein